MAEGLTEAEADERAAEGEAGEGAVVKRPGLRLLALDKWRGWWGGCPPWRLIVGCYTPPTERGNQPFFCWPLNSA